MNDLSDVIVIVLRCRLQRLPQEKMDSPLPWCVNFHTLRLFTNSSDVFFHPVPTQNISFVSLRKVT